MAWVLLFGRLIEHVTPEDIAQIHYLARLDRGGVCRVEIRTTGRLLDAYEVTTGTARAVLRCLSRHHVLPLQMAVMGLGDEILGDNPIRTELIRVRDRYRRWC